MFDPPPQRRNHLTVSDSLPLHPVPLNFPVWECSCAAAAILNYIGQWEIVCMLLFSGWFSNSEVSIHAQV